MAQETKRVLPMSTYDITKMYKEAKDKRAQIDILADMNACSTKEIREELIKGGIPFQTLPRKSRREKFTLEKKPQTLDGFVPVSAGESRSESPVTCNNEENMHAIVETEKQKDVKLVGAPKLTFMDIPEAVYKAVENEIAVVTKQIHEVEEVLKNAYDSLADLEAFMAKRKG